MIKKLLLLITVPASFLQPSVAQDIPNASFENWNSFGNYEDPAGWGTLNDRTSMLGIITASKATGADAYTGNALLLKTTNISFISRIVPGIAVTGRINDQTSTLEGGVPYKLRPESFSGWFKYAPAGTDSAIFGMVLFKWNSVTNKRDTVGGAMHMEGKATSVYTPFSVKIDYLSSDIPDSAMFILSASNVDNPKDGSILHVDDLGVNFATGMSQPEREKTAVYPNPAHQSLFFKNVSRESCILTVFDGAGNKVDEVITNDAMYAHPLSSYSNGIYIYTLYYPEKNLMETGKFTVHH